MFATSPYTDTVVTPEMVRDPLPMEPSDGLIWVVGPVLAVVFIIGIVISILLLKKWVGFGINGFWILDFSMNEILTALIKIV